MFLLCQRRGLRKRGHQYHKQRDENHGAADQHYDFAQHVRVHEIFWVHLRLPFQSAPAMRSRYLSIMAALCLEIPLIGQLSRLVLPIKT